MCCVCFRILFHSKLSLGELIGVGYYLLSSKVYVLPVPNLRVDCTIRFHVHIGDTEVEL